MAKNSLLNAVLALHKRGMAVVPIPRAGFEYKDRKGRTRKATGKGPIIPGWQKRRLSWEQLERLLKDDHIVGIGVVAGALSGDLAVLDFDGEGWQGAFEHFQLSWSELGDAPLVETGSGKRHIWLRCPDMPVDFTKRDFVREDLRAKIELRGNRCNCVAPPSLHPSGGRYKWVSAEADLVDVPFAELLEWLTEWAGKHAETDVPAEPLAASKHVPLGRKALEFVAHGAPVGAQRLRALAAARNYLSAGYSVEDTIEAVWRGLEVSPQGEPDNPWTYEDAVQIVEDLASRPAPPLKPLQRRGDFNTAAGGVPVDLDDSQEETTQECPPLPEEAQLDPELGANACKWLDYYVAFSQKWSPRSFEGFHEAVALWILSTVAARRVMIHFGKPRFTNLYIILGGRTTMHAKSSATDIGQQVLRACGLDFLLAADESTPASFVRSLARTYILDSDSFDALDGEGQALIKMRLAFAAQKGWFHEEFGTGIQSMMRADGIMADFRGLLRKLDDCPEEYRRSTISRGEEYVERPYLALIANLTPADLRPFAKRGAQLWGDGFLARFAFVTPPAGEVKTGYFPKGKRVIPPGIIAPLVEWHKRLGIPGVEVEEILDNEGKPTGRKHVTVRPPPSQLLSMSDEVWEAYYRYDLAVLRIALDSDNHDLDGNYGRLAEKALRTAALLASLSGKPAVELCHWARAQEIVERWRLYLHRLYEQVNQLKVSEAKEIEGKILDTLRHYQGTADYPDGMTANEIRRFVWGLGTSEVWSYAEQLVEAGVLAKHKPKRAERYFIPRPTGGA